MLSGLLEIRKLRARPVPQIVTKLPAASRVERSSLARIQMVALHSVVMSESDLMNTRLVDHTVCRDRYKHGSPTQRVPNQLRTVRRNSNHSQ